LNSYLSNTDKDLFKKIAAGDSKALEALYDRYSPILYTLIKKIVIKNPDAEEVLSQVFEIIWKKVEQFNFSTENVYTWLIILSRNKAIDYVRRQNPVVPLTTPYNDEYEDKLIIPRLSGKIDSIEFDEAINVKPKIEKALSKLTDAQKYVIHLGFYEGYTQRGIADKLKIPLTTVKSKVINSLRNLKDNLLKENA
jgi:RNA polymerase sigma-70 factor, ECF subfamily